ncbi:MAG TPA: c-type cytochrome [Usitatibacteraceae bacterium]|nr:c-type cytochrome [Usitatibacteraceae bacterium]
MTHTDLERRRSVGADLPRMVFLCCLAGAATLAVAQTPTPAAPPPPAFAASNLTPSGVRALAATCAACHGSNGHSVGGAIPGLAGINKEYFVNQMAAFREGRREATIMHQLSKGYSAAEVAALGDFFSAQKK